MYLATAIVTISLSRTFMQTGMDAHWKFDPRAAFSGATKSSIKHASSKVVPGPRIFSSVVDYMLLICNKFFD
ncbi:hypothetical protein M0657_010868 [Pyricularia oryzae]|uniref:Uncharacterized protein n=1 Tax=Pyricularia oryzae (strain P131) TaxID=1143193 RepID=L7J7L5_PYRO1|nr:hypothetical protein M0657_010868 [Pyricularia oryzae]